VEFAEHTYCSNTVKRLTLFVADMNNSQTVSLLTSTSLQPLSNALKNTQHFSYRI